MTVRNDTTQRTALVRTPGPWKAVQHWNDQHIVWAGEENAGPPVCIVYGTGTATSGENAAFIIDACNAYDTLRAQNAALREAMERISSALETAGEYSGGAQVARNIARAALQQSAPQGENK